MQQDPPGDAGLLLHLQRGGSDVATLDQDRHGGVKQLPFRGLATLALELIRTGGAAVGFLAVKANSSPGTANYTIQKIALLSILVNID